MSTIYHVNQPADFELVITDILRHHKESHASSSLLTLAGDLGAGKTAFTQQLGRLIGVSEPITSPTFTIMKQYEINHVYFDTLIHIDAYRFESEEEALPLRLDELLAQARTLICIEWPERIASFIPAQAIRIDISIGEGEQRLVQVTYPGESGRAV